MHQPNIKQKNAMERMLFAVAPTVAVVVERTEHELKNVTYKYKVIIANALFVFLFFLPETPAEGLLHSKRHRSTAKEALCGNLFGVEMGRCRTKRSRCFQVQ